MKPRFKMLLAIVSVTAVVFAVLPRTETYAATPSPVSVVAVHASPASSEATSGGARMDYLRGQSYGRPAIRLDSLP